MTALLDGVSRYLSAHAVTAGVVRTPVPGLAIVWASAPSGLDHAIARPLACLVLQGSKRVSVGSKAVEFGAGDSLVIAADVPTVSEITQASTGMPYLSVVLDIDPGIVAELTAEMGAARGKHASIRIAPTEVEVSDAALRLIRLFDRPESLSVLYPQHVRELHYWLLGGRHGPAIRGLGCPDGHARRVARAVALLRTEFARRLSVPRLAEAAGMSRSSFHRHFRAVTSLSPLQFQKQLRLIEARRLMVSQGVAASSAAFAVGYESVPQFTREYGRMFGRPPVRDAAAVRDQARAG